MMNIPKDQAESKTRAEQSAAGVSAVLDWQQKRALEYLIEGGNDSASSKDTGEGWFFIGSAAVILKPIQLGPMLKDGLIEMQGHRYVITDKGTLAILPHLSPESQALLRKELGDG